MSFELILPFLRPIEPLLLDESISEIMGNPDASWWYERDGIMFQEQNISFDADKLQTGLEVIANQLGKKLDEDNPILHAHLPDGSRLAAVIPPVVRLPPALIIRKFTSRHYTVDDLIARGTLTRPLADFLAEQIRSGKTLLISGGTGTGKTTLLRILADFIPDQDRIVVIEDTSELHIQKPNILAVECQTDTFKANISFDDLLKSALRWRPDRIILGEVRGIEARTLLDSFNTGHAGSLATIHANSAEKALHRFANLVMRSHTQTTFIDTEAEIGESVDFVVHIERQAALRGRVTDHHRFMLKLHLDQIDAQDAAIARIDKEVDGNVEPFRVRVQYCPDAALPEASGCSGYRILSFSPRSPLGEFGSPSTACCFETETFPSSACCYRQTFLGDIETVLVPVEACMDSRSAGYSCAMAPRRLQAVLDLALAAPGARGQEVHQRGTPRAHLPHGRREPDLGCAAHSWRTEDAWLRPF